MLDPCNAPGGTDASPAVGQGQAGAGRTCRRTCFGPIVIQTARPVRGHHARGCPGLDPGVRLGCGAITYLHAPESRALVGRDLSRRQCLDIVKKIRQVCQARHVRHGRDRACPCREALRPSQARAMRGSRQSPCRRPPRDSAARPRLLCKLRLGAEPRVLA